MALVATTVIGVKSGGTGGEALGVVEKEGRVATGAGGGRVDAGQTGYAAGSAGIGGGVGVLAGGAARRTVSAVPVA